MSYAFKIIHPNIENNQIFNVQLDVEKISHLFDLKIKQINPINEGYGDGIYTIHYKEKLIYIGRHNSPTNVTERWEKHLKTLTGRFLPMNFLGADKDPIKPNTVKKFYTFNEKKLSFNDLLDLFNKQFIQRKNNINSYPDIYKQTKAIIEKHIEKKRNDLDNRYPNLIKGEFHKFFENIDAFSNKKIIQTLTGEGSVTSPNRFNFAVNNRSDFLNKSFHNIFEDFTLFFYKYLGKKTENKKKDVFEFQNKYEKPLIKYFSPEANNDIDKGLKYINASKEDILIYLNQI